MKGPGRRWLPLGWIVLAFAALLVSLGLPRATASEEGDFCERPSANPYLEPLRSLPPLREPPEGRGLAVAPWITIRPVRGPLVIGGEPIGFVVRVRATTGQNAPARRWKGQATFWRLESDGGIRNLVKQISRPLDDGAVFVTEAPEEPAIYRVRLVLERADGSRIVRYGKYFRAGPREFAARIAVSTEEVTAGETLFARLENFGTTRIATGYGYDIQKLTGAGWKEDPVLQDSRPIPRVLVTLGPVSTFDCLGLSIPSDVAPGRYRLLKGVRDGHLARRNPIAREFTVVSPPSG